jgi:hypothetical protein
MESYLGAAEAPSDPFTPGRHADADRARKVELDAAVQKELEIARLQRELDKLMRQARRENAKRRRLAKRQANR